MKAKPIKIFYNDLANDYDSMTRFDERLKSEEINFRKLVKKYNFKKVLDAGCGTGFHSVILDKCGCTVTSVDVSEKMLKQLKINAAKYSVSVKVIKSDFLGLKTRTDDKYDAVFCLGNSLPHLLTLENIKQSLDSFYSVLKKDGKIFLQILNYDKILSQKSRIQNIREVDSKTFIRFYNYTKLLIEFNIMTIDKSGKEVVAAINSIPLFPIRKKTLHHLLVDSKFHYINFYSSNSLDKYKPSTSNDIFVVAEK
jgi:glycine/sarcosine N-methyltransferase